MIQTDIEANIIEKYFRHLVSFDPILNRTGSIRTLHKGGTRYQEKDRDATVPLKRLSFTIDIHYAAILNYELEIFAKNFYKFTEQRIAELHRMLYSTLDAITKLTGNVTDAKGKPPSIDMILDMYEKMPIDFDDKDQPLLPSIIADQELIHRLENTMMTLEQKERQKKIFDAKRQEYHAKKRYRRLSYLD
jgi:hypothetical protein